MSERKTGSARKTSAVDLVVNGIIDSIIKREIRPGGKLPTEPELSKEYNVGRNSVREAIKQLQAFGILEIRRADGTYVADSYNNHMLDPMLYSLILQEHDWQDFVQLREVIDIGTLRVALSDPGVVKIVPALEGILLQMKSLLEQEKPDIDGVLRLDLEFHSDITKTINNPMVTTVNNYVTLISIPSRRKSVEKWIADNKSETFIALHQQLIDVIATRDAGRIEQAVTAHYVYWK